VVKGAFVELPRYFADTGKVQDLESRLLTCMETLQGFECGRDRQDAVRPRRAGQHQALAAWISAESRGMRFNLPQGHAEEKKFHVRAGQAGCSSIAAGRTTSPARPATARTASASACRTCPT
jgi:hypothetical protein